MGQPVETSRFSGEQYAISHGVQHAVVTEVGGGLRVYTVDGENILDGYGLDDRCTSGRGQILAPWPNRIADGSYEFNGQSYQLPLTEPKAHNAIHGLVRWHSWRAREHGRNRVVVEHTLRPQSGYPFCLELSVEYALSDEGMAVSMSATNIGKEACPYGCGAHPYLTFGTAVDAVTLNVPAETVLLHDERGLSTRATAVAESEFDFRRMRAVGTTVLDHCFTDLKRGRADVAQVHLSTADRSVTLWVDQAFDYLMLFTGDPLPDVARRALAVEPMTCPPNAFRSGVNLMALAPGESFTGSWGITPE